mmetsp:Transcript_19260/g.68025  ORF Transcript_19260/g.68025 Transcript_19260/m.68025 type:complete len:750 (-) Transcript_19260:35-2284(-)
MEDGGDGKGDEAAATQTPSDSAAAAKGADDLGFPSVPGAPGNGADGGRLGIYDFPSVPGGAAGAAVGGGGAGGAGARAAASGSEVADVGAALLEQADDDLALSDVDVEVVGGGDLGAGAGAGARAPLRGGVDEGEDEGESAAVVLVRAILASHVSLGVLNPWQLGCGCSWLVRQELPMPDADGESAAHLGLARVQELERLLTLCRAAHATSTGALLAIAGIAEEDLLHVEWRRRHMRPAHFVAVDHARRAVVVAVCGTKHASDWLRDMAAAPVRFLDGYAHTGMAHAAEWLAEDLTPLVEAALRSWEGYSVDVVGHSLGAGVAALLGLLWSASSGSAACDGDGAGRGGGGAERGGGFPVQATAFAAPPCVCARLAARSEAVVTGVVYNDDVVPRMSVANLRRLAELVRATQPLWTADLKDRIAGSAPVRAASATITGMRDSLRSAAPAAASAVEATVGATASLLSMVTGTVVGASSAVLSSAPVRSAGVMTLKSTVRVIEWLVDGRGSAHPRNGAHAPHAPIGPGVAAGDAADRHRGRADGGAPVPPPRRRRVEPAGVEDGNGCGDAEEPPAEGALLAALPPAAIPAGAAAFAPGRDRDADGAEGAQGGASGGAGGGARADAPEGSQPVVKRFVDPHRHRGTMERAAGADDDVELFAAGALLHLRRVPETPHHVAYSAPRAVFAQVHLSRTSVSDHKRRAYAAGLARLRLQLTETERVLADIAAGGGADGAKAAARLLEAREPGPPGYA